MPVTKTETLSPPVIPTDVKHWVYGWTHYQMSGQSLARMDTRTRELEVKDRNQWIRCLAGSEAFFTPRCLPK